jgi:processive 1,2-diacylglycerol beta-glucosyltransferase
LQARHAIVVTDYDVHAMWLCRTVDRYYVALPESAEYLACIGVPREKLRVTGIPVDLLFAKRVNQAEARRRLGVDSRAQVVLIAAGRYGLGPVEQLVKGLLALERPWQIVAIAGKSEKLKKRLEQISRSAGNLAGGGGRLVTVGFTQEIDQYMAAADLLVGKAGGLTTSEALAREYCRTAGMPGKAGGDEERGNRDGAAGCGAAHRRRRAGAATLIGLPDRDVRPEGTKHYTQSRL